MGIFVDPKEGLRSCRLFTGLTEAEIQQLKSALGLKHRVFSSGDRVCSTGDSGNEIWIIGKGQVEIFLESGGEEAVLVDRRQGEIIGEQAFLGGKRTTSMRARERTDVYILERACLDALPDDRLKAIIWHNIAAILSEKLAQASDKREDLIAQGRSSDKLLEHFVNSHGLDRVRGGLKSDYAKEQVVVWFSDLVGFGAVSAAVKPDAVAELIRNCMQAQSSIIESLGGYVDKFMGDGLMAFWAFPDNDVQRRDACKKAFKAAQEAIQAIEATASPLSDHDLGLRVGLHVGTAISGNFGSEERWAYTLIGQDVNIAARLEQAKGQNDQGMPYGSLRVSEEFRNLLPIEQQEQVRQAVRIQVKELERTIFCSSLAPKEGQHDRPVDKKGC